jgi:hypothetical protein
LQPSPTYYETLRHEDWEGEATPAVAVVVQWHDRQVHMIVDPNGENWDWAVAEYVRQAKAQIRAMERKDAQG